MKLSLLPPAVILKTTKKAKWRQASSLAMFVFARPQTPEHSIQHELFHVWQFYVVWVILFAALAPFVGWYFAALSFGVHPLARTYIREYRFHIEASAMAWQLRYLPISRLPELAGKLSDHYSLGKTKAQCAQLIHQYYKLLRKI